MICPEYNSIKSQISRYIKKQLPPDISKFNEIPDKSEYKTVKKCKSYIIQYDNNKVIKYENKHTHPGKEYDALVSVVKYKMYHQQTYFRCI